LAGLRYLPNQKRGDKKARYDKENVNTNKTARKERDPRVINQHRKNGDCTQPFNIPAQLTPVPRKRTWRGRRETPGASGHAGQMPFVSTTGVSPTSVSVNASTTQVTCCRKRSASVRKQAFCFISFASNKP